MRARTFRAQPSCCLRSISSLRLGLGGGVYGYDLVCYQDDVFLVLCISKHKALCASKSLGESGGGGGVKHPLKRVSLRIGNSFTSSVSKILNETLLMAEIRLSS